MTTNENLQAVDFDPFESGELADAAPMTAAQHEIWVASRMGDDTSLAYNESITIELRGAVDVAALRAALGELVRRHESLRATFSPDGKQMCIARSLELPLPLIDLSAAPPDARDARLDELIATEAKTAFDLERGPLVRASLAKLAEDDYRLILGSHHIVCDGWSFAVLLKDLGPIYSAKRAARPFEIAPAIPFSVYARDEWARDKTREESYWVAHVTPAPAALDLPTDRPRPPIRSATSERVDLALDRGLVAALKKAGARQGASFFVTLLTAFEVFLARVSGQTDLVVGIPAAGQSAKNMEMLVGHCANLLPLRAALDLDKPFGDLVKQVRKVVLDGYDHQLFTLGAVLPKLALPRDPSRLPLTPILFNLDTGIEGGGLAFDGLEVSFRANPRVAETFELFLNAFESGGGVVLECQYSTALWDRQTVAAWLRGYEALLTAIAAGSSEPCALLPIVGEAARALLLEVGRGHSTPIPEWTIVDRVLEQAARTPDKAAVKDAAGSLSYRELGAAIASAAARLSERGVGPGDLVGVATSRTRHVLPAILGVLATGAAYVPIDPEYPRERVALMLEPTKLVLTDEDGEDAVSGSDTEAVELAELWKGAPPAAFASRARIDGRAYVLFTSGSTGKPKGVEVTHRNLANFVAAMLRDPGLREDDVLAAVVTLSFDIAGYEMFVPLAGGATIFVVDRDTAQDGRDLGELLSEQQVTVLQATPSTYRLLRAAQFQPKGLHALVGGEMFPTDLAAWLLAGGARVVNCYGPTETTIWSTLEHVTRVDGPIPIGRPMDNQSTYVLDPKRQLVPPGVFGELYIGGAGVTNGYLGDTERTAERFVSDPFSPGGRLYRTGDTARVRHDGTLEFLGRSDDQVKVRGHRIELAEIEAALGRHPSVAEGAVAVVREGGTDARLVAFIVPRSGESLTVTDLRRHLRKTLPDAMIPPQLVEVVALPRTPNGKLDRKELARLGAGQRKRERELVAPATPTERMMEELVKSTLRVDSLSMTDNFFDLGGDSLRSMEIVVQIEKQTGVRVTPRRLLLSSLADVARGITEAVG